MKWVQLGWGHLVALCVSPWPGTWFFVKQCVSLCCSGCTTCTSAKYGIKDYQGIFICCPQNSSKLPSKLIFSRMQSTKGGCSYLNWQCCVWLNWLDTCMYFAAAILVFPCILRVVLVMSLHPLFFTSPPEQSKTWSLRNIQNELVQSIIFLMFIHILQRGSTALNEHIKPRNKADMTTATCFNIHMHHPQWFLNCGLAWLSMKNMQDSKTILKTVISAKKCS